MSILKTPVTRDLEFHETKSHQWYFTLSEGKQIIYQSDPVNKREECIRDGLDFMDKLHDEAPLHTNFIPTIDHYIRYTELDRAAKKVNQKD